MLSELYILKEINSHGFLTTESQAGRITKGKDFKIHERAYITGFMLESDAPKFIKNMNLYTDKNAVFVPECNDDIKIPPSPDIPLTFLIRK